MSKQKYSKLVLTVGDQITFTSVAHRKNILTSSITLKTAYGKIVSIDKQYATVQLTRGGLVRKLLKNLTHKDKPTSLTKAFSETFSV